MKLTTNYGLKKPDASDIVNIDDFNYNADAIDSAIKEVKTKVDSLNLTATNVKMSDGSTVEDTVSANKTSIQSANSSISTLQSSVNTNKTSISTLQSSVNTNKTNITNLQSSVNTNKASILEIQNELDNHKKWLYKKNDEYTGTTGGWYVQEEANTGRVQKLTDYMRYYTTSTNTGDCGSHTRTTNLINVTQYSKVHVEYVVSTTNSGMIEIQCFNSSNSRVAYAKRDFKTSSELICFTLDISNINTDIRVQVGMGISVGTHSNVDLKVYKIWLEK